MNKIKVIIIDDCPITRKVLSCELNKDLKINVIATANDAISGRDKIVYYNPDVIVLDIIMPKINGLNLLKQIVIHKPTPVIVISSAAGSLSRKALTLGAFKFIQKPESNSQITYIKEELIKEIKNAVQLPYYEKNILSDKIIAIGASTGGTTAIKKVLMKLPADMPPIVIVQHMPGDFTHSFADHLNEVCALTVKEAEDNDILESGKVLLAPGNKHMILKKIGDIYKVSLRDGPLVYFQKPSVEVLFNSVAKVVQNKAIGVILTGMGKDGAEGLLNMKHSGAFTIGQDEKSSTVYGMPKEAFKMGAVMKQLPLDKIPDFLVYLSKK